MKITMFSDAYYPIIDGVVRFVDHLAKILHDEGYEVTLVIPRYYSKPKNFYTERPFKFLFLPTLPVNVKGYYGALPTPTLYHEIKQTDLIIINSLAFTAVYALLVNCKFNKTVIEFVHADERVVLNKTAEVPQFMVNLLITMMKKMTQHIDYFAVATNTFEKRTLEYGAPSHSIFRVPFGYTPKEVNPIQLQEIRKFYGIDPDKVTILYLGRLSDEKNIDTIVEVMGRITKENDQIQAIIAGGGYRYTSLKKYIQDHEYNVIITGRVPDRILPPLYSIADIFYSPSNHEALCFTVIEAMSYATIPVINAEFKENELNRHNSVQLLDINDVEETISILQNLITDPERMQALKENITVTAKIFTWTNFRKAWKSKIESINT